MAAGTSEVLVPYSWRLQEALWLPSERRVQLPSQTLMSAVTWEALSPELWSVSPVLLAGMLGPDLAVLRTPDPPVPSCDVRVH